MNDKQCIRCNSTDKVIKSKNKLVGNICLKCLSELIDFDDVNDVKLLSETFQIDFNPNQFFLAQMNAPSKEEALEEYLRYLVEREEGGSIVGEGKVSAFNMINQEWKEIKSYHNLLLSMSLFRDEFQKRATQKWGYSYSFEELIKLENLFTSTVKTFNVTDPIKKDALRKATVSSLMIDNAIHGGDTKTIKELTAAYQGFLKIAGVDHVEGVVSDDGTIRTVADLIAYLEERDYKVESNYVEKKDIVDMTLDNILENTRLILSEKTGLDVEVRDMIEKAENLLEEKVSEEVYEREALSEDYYEEIELALEADLNEEEEDDFDIEDIDFLGE